MPNNMQKTCSGSCHGLFKSKDNSQFQGKTKRGQTKENIFFTIGHTGSRFGADDATDGAATADFHADNDCVVPAATAVVSAAVTDLYADHGSIFASATAIDEHQVASSVSVPPVGPGSAPGL